MKIELLGNDIKLPDIDPKRLGARAVPIGAAIILGLTLIWGTVYQVEPEEAGVVLRLGQYVRTTDPGLRFKIPFLERVQKVPVESQLKQEFGFRTVTSGVRSDFTTAGLSGESLMLTGDLNVAVVEWTTQYTVADPYKYLFKVKNLDNSDRRNDTFRAMNEAVMREVIGDRSVNEVLTIGRQEIASEVELRLQELCDQYETGLKIEQVVLQDVNPPDPVKPSFNEVNEAEAEREKLIELAKADYNSVIPRARGEAQRVIQQAEGYATERVNRSVGDAEAFNALRAAYRRAPEVTRRRLYLEAMQRVLPKVKRKVILDEDLQGLLPLLPLQTGGGQ